MEGAILPTSLQTTQHHVDRYGCHRFVPEPDLEERHEIEQSLSRFVTPLELGKWVKKETISLET
jgi:hypothetical protein